MPTDTPAWVATLRALAQPGATLVTRDFASFRHHSQVIESSEFPSGLPMTEETFIVLSARHFITTNALSNAWGKTVYTLTVAGAEALAAWERKHEAEGA